MCNTAKNVEYN